VGVTEVDGGDVAFGEKEVALEDGARVVEGVKLPVGGLVGGPLEEETQEEDGGDEEGEREAGGGAGEGEALDGGEGRGAVRGIALRGG
jgi:hypothetical protein